VGQMCFTPPFFVERRHKMGIRDWDIVTSYVDSVTTSLKTVTFPKVQEQVKVKNQGNANLTYTIGSQSGTLTPGQSITVNESISSFTIQAASGTQAFELRAKEKGTEQIEAETDVMSLLTDKVAKSYVDQQISTIGNASPKGTYATLTALQTAFPTGTTGIYLVTADGKWYYWNGSAWTAGGTYQSTGISDGSITFKQTNFFTTINLFDPSQATTGALNYGTGVSINSINTGVTWFYASPIYDVVAGEKISIITPNVETNESVVVFYDSSNAYVSSVPFTANGTGSVLNGLTVPANAAKMRFRAVKTYSNPGAGITQSYLTFTMYAKGVTVPSVYIPYGDFTAPSLHLSDGQVSELRSVFSIDSLINGTTINKNSKFFVPNKLYLIKGRNGKRRIKKENVLIAHNLNDFYINQSELSPWNMDDNYSLLDDATAGNSSFWFNLSNSRTGDIVYQSGNKTASIIDKATLVNPSSTKNVLMIGDSFTDQGFFPTEVKNILVNEAGLTNINFIGKRTATKNGVTALHQGYSGLTVLDYIKTDNTQGQSGVGNPFNFSGTISFTQYMSSGGFTGSLDYVVIELGVNDNLALGSTVDVIKTRMQQLIGFIHTDYPNAKIFVVGQRYISRYTDYTDATQWNKWIMDFNKAYQDLCESTSYSGFCSYIDIGLLFDIEYGSVFQMSAPYKGSTETVRKITDWLHPNEMGYNQMAENVAGAIASKLT
jgi:lysophospholipase L1-like esterase